MTASTTPRIGVLALQGAFREHVQSLRRCGAEAVEIRTCQDMEGLAGLVLPGGESTVMGKLLEEWGLREPLQALCRSGAPVFGTCAGMILLCREIVEHPKQPKLDILDIAVRRNAFGRQVDSFTTSLVLDPFPVVGDGAHMPLPAHAPLPAVFIRAPFVERVGADVQVLAHVDGHPVAVRQGNVLATSFHPELTDDVRLHQWVVDTARKRGSSV